MPRRFSRRIKYYRGTRTCGGGNVKNRRGKGNRGGRGYAGAIKHRWTYIIKYEKHHLGKRGFKPPRKKRLPTINLWEISKMGVQELEFRGKVLGAGRLKAAVRIKALSWSKKAEEKVKAVGGSIEPLEA